MELPFNSSSDHSRRVDSESFAGMQVYLGDMHNHCGISYGHGSIEDAFANAKLQLDFGTVTGHAWWHDLPVGVPEVSGLVQYHQEGFQRLADCWDHVQDVTADAHVDGEFVSFLSFEWHSSRYGDHCVYYNGDRGKIIRADSLEQMRVELRKARAAGTGTMVLPHHIGYMQGRRGANWSAFTPEFTPVVEMMSMHGCGESEHAPRPYLHTMGPRHTDNTAVRGLALGHRFGLIGSTDHHSAHPGSHGHGRVAAWSTELTRAGIWEAFQQRRVYALTGDPIVLGFSINDTPMGSVAAPSTRRRIAVEVQGEAPIDMVEVTRNGTVIHRHNGDIAGSANGDTFDGAIPFSVGWGNGDTVTHWDAEVRIEQGQLTGVTPRLRGEDIVAPTADAPEVYHFSNWGRDENSAWLRTATHGNPNVVTDGTQGLNLHLEGDDRTVVVLMVNGRESRHRLGELRLGSVDTYLEPFPSPAYRLGQAIARTDLTVSFELTDDSAGDDWYHVRVRQTNDQWAWSSPILGGWALAATQCLFQPVNLPVKLSDRPGRRSAVMTSDTREDRCLRSACLTTRS